MPANEGRVVEVADLRRVYGSGETEVRALDGVDLAIDAGEFVAVTGPSGSGKSTFMNVIGFLDRPTSGRVLFHGVDVTDLSHEDRARLRRDYLGFVFQGYNLLPRTKAVENVELALVYRRVPGPERRARALEVLADVGLAGREHHMPNELSGGQQQRVAIARALVSRPSLVLADEPTGNLDTARKDEILRLLLRLNRDSGLTIVMVTHEPDVARWASRIVQFRDGRVASDKPNFASEL